MKIKQIFTLSAAIMTVFFASAQDIPTINPTAVYTNEGETEEGTVLAGSAPLNVRFEARAESADGYAATYEWRFTMEGEETPYLVRYEENTEYTFTRAGSHRIELYATFIQGNDTVAYTQEYWSEAEPLRVTVSESRLEMPNAFSPNDDGINDIYRAKEYQSLTEFHAYIFNRWGQKLYEWSDPAGGWDGKFKGKDVKQGVYFVLVKAKGADGREYHIRRDVNLLRGYTEKTQGSTDY